MVVSSNGPPRKGMFRHEAPPPCDDRPLNCQRRHGGVVFVIVALALLLAIGFFFLKKEKREDAQAQAITEAAQTVDNAAQSVGNAAQRAMDKLKYRKPSKE